MTRTMPYLKTQVNNNVLGCVMPESKTFSVRLPKPLLAKIEQRAAGDRRSVNNLITKILAEWLEAKDQTE
ncbi:Arc family DNA-binding protein [Tundrisphaera lichenicola]|uniref:Arc family DNA-binding protein n=1 Tax=Tundrisphaera lichenicola TaxID=2029860 RepID=UPI003EB860E5